MNPMIFTEELEGIYKAEKETCPNCGCEINRFKSAEFNKCNPCFNYCDGCWKDINKEYFMPPRFKPNKAR